MNKGALRSYPLDVRLSRTPSSIMQDLKPVFRKLLNELLTIDDQASLDETLPIFKAAILKINDFADDIETVEREEILDMVYEIGDIVGVPPSSQFAEEWRGDW